VSGGHGGRREGAGRKPGIPNRCTTEIRLVAQQHGPAIIAKLAELAGVVPGIAAESQGVQVAAMKELLDRGYGRATQPLTGDAEKPLTAILFEWAPAASAELVHAHPAINGDAVVEFAESGGNIALPRASG
jgi:hypothetical protein